MPSSLNLVAEVVEIFILRSHLLQLNHPKNHNNICCPNCGESVGNYDYCPPCRSLINCFLHSPFRLSIQGTGGFIKKQDFWISDEGSCYGNSLLLTTRQLKAKLTNLKNL